MIICKYNYIKFTTEKDSMSNKKNPIEIIKFNAYGLIFLRILLISGG